MTSRPDLYCMPLPSERHIRILVLHPAVRLDSPISCTLKEISLDAIRDKKHQYEALSYVWGSPAGDREVTCNKRALLVTENCLLALRYLRRKTRKRLLWVDAICINQESIEERNIQVRLMGDVYSLSKHVLIWLGIGDVQTKMLFRLFWLISRYWFLTGQFDKHLSTEQFVQTNRWLPELFQDPVLNLLGHDWFRRAWTLQELALASFPMVVCGHRLLTWDIFSQACKHSMPYYIEMFGFVSANSRLWAYPRFEHVVHIRHIATSNFKGSRQFYTPTGDLDVVKEYGNHPEHQFINEVRNRQASDPKDHIYAIFQVLQGLGLHLPAPDYTISVAAVFQELTAALIQQRSSLWALLAVPSAPRMEGLPSWVPDYTQPPLYPSWTGLPLEKHDYFRDSYQPIMEHSNLVLEGKLFGIVNRVSSRAKVVPLKRDHTYFNTLLLTGKEIAAEWIAAAHSLDDHESAKHALSLHFFIFTESLLAGLNIAEGKEEEYETEKENFLLLVTLAFKPERAPDLVTQLVGSHDDPVPPSPYDLLQRLLHRVQFERTQNLFNFFIQRNMRLLVLEDNRFALSTGDVNVGDNIVFCHGASFGLVLRSVGESYRYNGPALVEGVEEKDRTITGLEEDVTSIILS